MTAKQQLRERIETFSEQEASQALRLLDLRPTGVLLDDAPLDDEPTSPEEEAAVAEALEAASRGETISLDELRAELQ